MPLIAFTRRSKLSWARNRFRGPLCRRSSFSHRGRHTSTEVEMFDELRLSLRPIQSNHVSHPREEVPDGHPGSGDKDAEQTSGPCEYEGPLPVAARQPLLRSVIPLQRNAWPASTPRPRLLSVTRVSRFIEPSDTFRRVLTHGSAHLRQSCRPGPVGARA